MTPAVLDTRRLKVLSLNMYTMGHITYQNSLERIFDRHAQIDFHSVHLPEHTRQDLPARVLYWLLSRRLPWAPKKDIDFIRLRLELANSFFATRLLRRVVRDERPDVLHLHTQAIALLGHSLLRRWPTVVSIDATAALLSQAHTASAPITYKPIVELERRCFQTVRHIIAWSDWARQSVIEDYGIAPHKVTTIPPAVPQDLFKAMARHEQRIQGKVRLLFVGNDFTRKGGEDLVSVFLEHFSKTCELDLVTNCPQAMPVHPGLRVHRGLRPFSSELLDLYAKADIFTMPTLEDVSPLVFVEAMAASLPCVGTGVMGVGELVRNGINGLTIPPGDRRALRAVLGCLVEDAELRSALGRAGRERAARDFDAAINGERLARVFRELAACSGSAASSVE